MTLHLPSVESSVPSLSLVTVFIQHLILGERSLQDPLTDLRNPFCS